MFLLAPSQINERDILEDLRRRGVVEEILSRLRFESPVIAPHKKPSHHKKLDEELLQAEFNQKGREGYVLLWLQSISNLPCFLGG